jgi:uncharacterized membrane protein (UPF0127 family)
MLSLWLTGCSPPAPAHSGPGGAGLPNSPAPTAQTLPSGGQQLAISAKATIAGQVIQLEVARTPEQQSTGLMYRTSLADDRGMLFPFDPPRPVGFWMKNVPINLDMIFLRNGEVKEIAANVPPCTATPCSTYGPAGTAVDGVIELRGGRAAELGLKAGDRIAVEFLDADSKSGEQGK